MTHQGFRNERQFSEYVEGLLRRQGFEVSREVSVERGYRVDLVAAKEGTRIAIEVKFTARDVADAIVKAKRLLQSPSIDEAYACAPVALISEEARVLADDLRVGLIGVESGQLLWLRTSDRLKPSYLSMSGGYPSRVKAGQTFEVAGYVRNMGEKLALDVKFSYLSAGPFVRPRGTPKEWKRQFMQPLEEWRQLMPVKAKPNAPAGKHPLLLWTTSRNVRRSDSLCEIEITG